MTAMGAGLVVAYLAGEIQAIAAGLLAFVALGLLRPDLALLFVPLMAPMFIAPLRLPAPFTAHVPLPPHELALLTAAAGALADSCRAGSDRLLPPRRHGERPEPAIVFALAGLFGLALALGEPLGRADSLNAFRWYIAEPLIFAQLLRSQWAQSDRQVDRGWPAIPSYAIAFVAGGALAGLVGLMQFAGVRMPIEGPRFTVLVPGLGEIPRVTSVYGNPNNLGLYLGRVWPVAAALTIGALASRKGRSQQHGPRTWVLVLSSVLCLTGLLLSFSRGAWLGAGVAAAVLAIPLAVRRPRRRLLPAAALALATVAIAGVLIFTLRGGTGGGSTTVRLLLWRGAATLLAERPQGVGLGQFYYYHNPAFNRGVIDPALANTSEREVRQPHNLLLELWLELGPPGVLAFGWLLHEGLRQARQALRAADTARTPLIFGALAALAASLVHGLVDTFYFWPDLALAFWLLLALIRTAGAPELGAPAGAG